MPIVNRRLILRANALYLGIAAIASLLLLDLRAVVFGTGPAGAILAAAPHAAIGFVEAHGLAFIVAGGFTLWRVQEGQESLSKFSAAQGVSLSYNEDGQLVTGSFMDYAIPRAIDFPPFELTATMTPTPVNPIGAKGVGEAGTLGSTPCIVSAAVDALSEFGVRHIDMMLRPEKLWRIIQGGQS